MRQEFEERIKTFKASQKREGQNSDVFLYEIENDDDNKILECYLKAPDRNVMRMVLAIINQDQIKANEILLEKCWICGDEILKTNDKYFMGLSNRLGELINYKVGELKKV